MIQLWLLLPHWWSPLTEFSTFHQSLSHWAVHCRGTLLDGMWSGLDQGLFQNAQLWGKTHALCHLLIDITVEFTGVRISQETWVMLLTSQFKVGICHSVKFCPKLSFWAYSVCLWLTSQMYPTRAVIETMKMNLCGRWMPWTVHGCFCNIITANPELKTHKQKILQVVLWCSELRWSVTKNALWHNFVHIAV